MLHVGVGYDSCITPGAKWFGHQPFLKEAHAALRALPGEPQGVRSLCQLYGFRLLTARTIVLIGGNAPRSGDVRDLLRQAAEQEFWVKLDFAPHLLALANKEFEVSYGGTGQYGVPNFTLTSVDISIYATSSESAPLIKRAYLERADHALTAWRTAITGSFAVYWAERWRDLTYDSYWEGKEEDEVADIVISHGLFENREAVDAVAREDFDNLYSMPAVRKLGRELQQMHWKKYFESNWRDFNESDAIWHGCSD